MSDAVRLEEVTKVFGRTRHHNLGMKETLLHPVRTTRALRASRFTAIHELDLTIGAGETFGLVGRNGAGKSTLLALIAGVLRPTLGRVTVTGRVAPLLELGVGFVVDLDARANIELSGILLGLLQSEVRERVDSVLEFAGLTDVAEEPLKNFSSGMLSRLGFSLAVHTDPDVLLMDEVLAVGDAEFQDRCLERVDELHRSGVTIVFVSHDLETLGRTCDRAAWVDAGRLASVGPPDEVVTRYLDAIGPPTDGARSLLPR
jgi:lipopolysaccharide transport system ATP-binding protein